MRSVSKDKIDEAMLELGLDKEIYELSAQEAQILEGHIKMDDAFKAYK